ncbi:uncharacterized protein [Littorina saxatilis]|uniref:uncharacterized protein n=1 Tax=Littorina saxatilis TaxID=31220 RepID=UPI0038B628CB
MSDSDKRRGKSDPKGKIKSKSSSSKATLLVTDQERNTLLAVPISAPSAVTTSASFAAPSATVTSAPVSTSETSSSLLAPGQGALVSSLLKSLVPEIRSLVQAEFQRSVASSSAFPASGSDVRALASVSLSSTSGLDQRPPSSASAGKQSWSDSPREAPGRSPSGDSSFASGHDRYLADLSFPAITYEAPDLIEQRRQSVSTAAFPALAGSDDPSAPARYGGRGRMEYSLTSGPSGSRSQPVQSSLPHFAVPLTTLPVSAGNASSSSGGSFRIPDSGLQRAPSGFQAPRLEQASLHSVGGVTSAHPAPVFADGRPAYPLPSQGFGRQDDVSAQAFPVSGLPGHASASGTGDFGHGSTCDYSDAPSVVSEESRGVFPSKLKSVLDVAAEVTSRYFPEGVVAADSSASFVPSAMADFRPAQEDVSSFRFAESPSVAYQLSHSLVRPAHAGSGIRPVPVPLLLPFGPVPESAQQWVASAAQASSFVPTANRKLGMPNQSQSWLASFALPRATLPVSRELLPLLTKPIKRDSVLPVSEASLLSAEELGRRQIELSSIAETLVRALSRALTDSLVPFTLSEEQNADDVSALLTALAKVNEEQLRLSSLQYTQAVLCRRDLFLSQSQFTELATRETLRVSPVSEESLFCPLALDARQKEIQSNKDSQFLDYTLKGVKQSQPSKQKQAQTSSNPKPAQKRQAPPAARGGKKRTASGRGRGGSGSKPHPQ